MPPNALLPILLCASVLSATRSPAADAPSDETYNTAVKLVQRALATTAASPLSDNGEAAGVIAALRSSHDRDLTPIFDKIAHSKVDENQIYGMVASAILYKESQSAGDPATAPSAAAAADAASHVDMNLLLNSKAPELVGAAYASLIDAQVLSPEQLLQIAANKSSDAAHRVMADAELDRIHKLSDLADVRQFLNDPNHVVRYYAGSVLLSSKDPSDVNAALATLKDLSDSHNLQEAPVQALILVRMQDQKQSAGVPWAAQVAGDDGFDIGLRFTAVSTLLSLHAPEGARAFSQLVKTQHGLPDQVKLGLIALGHPTDLNAAMIAPLTTSDSRLAQSVAQIARKAIAGDSTADLIALIKVGDPIILDWSLSYTDHLDEGPQLAIRTALVNEARIVDNERENDYETAALAAERMLETDGPAGRKAVAALLQSENRAVVEASLAGLYRSNVQNQSELVMPIWDGLTKTTSTETAANYAALILAREGHKEPLNWLPGMVAGGASVQGPGFRALASWYYAKLTGHGPEFVKAVLAD